MFSENRPNVTVYSILFVQSQAVASPKYLWVFSWPIWIRQLIGVQNLWMRHYGEKSCFSINATAEMSKFLSIPSSRIVNVSSFKHPSSSAYWGFPSVFALDFKIFNAGLLDFLFPTLFVLSCLQRKNMSLHIYDLLSSLLIWCVYFYWIPCWNSISVPEDSF